MKPIPTRADIHARAAYDDARDRVLERAGVKVLRVPATALLHQPDDVVAWIVFRCEAVAATLTPPSRAASRFSDGEETVAMRR